ncbi:MAG TPA: sugar phosphate isomerase/epimerase family protein [Vicinamibacterales bacterium]|nr:sugar phosphate isomerase/epimerase family protein [Vicinamibacterales bacterium]
MRAFGISTHLFHSRRLERDHLKAIAAHGFDQIELAATRSHFDYHNQAAVATLQEWLAEAGVTLHSVHAPTSETFPPGRREPPFSLASADPSERARALEEAEQALQIARRIPYTRFIVHLGVPRTLQRAPADNNRDSARRSIESLVKAAEPLGVTVAIELIRNELSRPASLVHFIENVLDAPAGICLDFGHAHLEGDLTDTVELVSEHLTATHLQDNRGRTDDHLVPFDGSVDWPSALTAVQKVGYDGTLMLEVAAHGPELDALKKARAARQRMEQLLAAW